jgi:hypothetical protein
MGNSSGKAARSAPRCGGLTWPIRLATVMSDDRHVRFRDQASSTYRLPSLSLGSGRCSSVSLPARFLPVVSCRLVWGKRRSSRFGWRRLPLRLRSCRDDSSMSLIAARWSIKRLMKSKSFSQPCPPRDSSTGLRRSPALAPMPGCLSRSARFAGSSPTNANGPPPSAAVLGYRAPDASSLPWDDPPETPNDDSETSAGARPRPPPAS